MVDAQPLVSQHRGRPARGRFGGAGARALWCPRRDGRDAGLGQDGPDLSDEQLAGLVAAFAQTGVRTVVATNTQPRPVPGGHGLAGVSGSRLRPSALDVVARLNRTINVSGLRLDIIAGGGILEGFHLRAFRAAGARAAMLYTAMVLRGPLAAALILREAEEGEPDA